MAEEDNKELAKLRLEIAKLKLKKIELQELNQLKREKLKLRLQAIPERFRASHPFVIEGLSKLANGAATAGRAVADYYANPNSKEPVARALHNFGSNAERFARIGKSRPPRNITEGYGKTLKKSYKRTIGTRKKHREYFEKLANYESTPSERKKHDKFFKKASEALA